MSDRKTLTGEVALTDLLDRLYFSDEQVGQAAMEQAKLFMAAATYRVKKMRVRQQAEADLDNARVTHSLRLRRQGKLNGKNITERHLTDLVDGHEDMAELRAAVAKAKQHEEWAKLLLEAYSHRRDAIKVLAQFTYLEDSFKIGGNRLKEERDRLLAKIKKRRTEED